MSLNFHQLLLFYTVAQLGSVTRAAKALRISQPSVSTQLREFEQRQGVELLRRLPRGMALTDAGRLAFAHAQKVFVAADNLQSALDGFRKAETGRLTIGGSITAGEFFLPAVIRTYQESYPRIDLVLALHNSSEVIERVLRRELDIGFVGMADIPAVLATIPCWRDEIVVIAAPGKIPTKSVSIASLSSRRFVMREAGSGTRQQVERTLRSHGIELKTAMTVSSPEAVKRYVMSGVGWGFASRQTIAMEAASGHLVIVEVKGWSCFRDFMVVHRKDQILSPAQAKFLEMAKEL